MAFSQQPACLTVMSQRCVFLSLLRQRLAQAQVGFGEFGANRHRSPELRGRSIKLSLRR